MHFKWRRTHQDFPSICKSVGQKWGSPPGNFVSVNFAPARGEREMHYSLLCLFPQLLSGTKKSVCNWRILPRLELQLRCPCCPALSSLMMQRIGSWALRKSSDIKRSPNIGHSMGVWQSSQLNFPGHVMHAKWSSREAASESLMDSSIAKRRKLQNFWFLRHARFGSWTLDKFTQSPEKYATAFGLHSTLVFQLKCKVLEFPKLNAPGPPSSPASSSLGMEISLDLAIECVGHFNLLCFTICLHTNSCRLRLFRLSPLSLWHFYNSHVYMYICMYRQARTPGAVKSCSFFSMALTWRINMWGENNGKQFFQIISQAKSKGSSPGRTRTRGTSTIWYLLSMLVRCPLWAPQVEGSDLLIPSTFIRKKAYPCVFSIWPSCHPAIQPSSVEKAKQTTVFYCWLKFGIIFIWAPWRDTRTESIKIHFQLCGSGCKWKCRKMDLLSLSIIASNGALNQKQRPEGNPELDWFRNLEFAVGGNWKWAIFWQSICMRRLKSFPIR